MHRYDKIILEKAIWAPCLGNPWFIMFHKWIYREYAIQKSTHRRCGYETWDARGSTEGQNNRFAFNNNHHVLINDRIVIVVNAMYN